MAENDVVRRDCDVEGYPLPIDPTTGYAWWRYNMALCLSAPGYREWQGGRAMDRIIPVLRWFIHGAIPTPTPKGPHNG